MSSQNGAGLSDLLIDLKRETYIEQGRGKTADQICQEGEKCHDQTSQGVVTLRKAKTLLLDNTGGGVWVCMIYSSLGQGPQFEGPAIVEAGRQAGS